MQMLFYFNFVVINIYGGILESWFDVVLVFYLYMIVGMVVLLLKDGLLFFNQWVFYFINIIVYYDYEGIVIEDDEWKMFVWDFGDKWVMFFCNYGMIMVG